MLTLYADCPSPVVTRTGPLPVMPWPSGESRNTAVVFRPQGTLEVERLAGPPRGFRTRIVSSRPLTPTTHALEVEKPKVFTFGPTQFTFLQLQTEDGMDARPMSLATSPTRPHLEYAVRLSDSPYKRAFAALQPGDEVRVFGPIGDFVLHETQPAVLLAAEGHADPNYYVSGTPSMVIVTLRLVRALGVPDANLEVEAFRGYG